jgi:predicted nucleic acid-binding protein
VKKRVYVETSVISYLTARPSRDIIQLGRQQLTATWWERRKKWELFLSPPVLDEAGQGDAEASIRRVIIARQLFLEPILPEAEKLASSLVAQNLIPVSVLTDALHLALAAVHKADYLLTWNQRHLDNMDTRFKIEKFIENKGYSPAVVITPERLLEVG